MILNDQEIVDRARAGMIEPFEEKLVSSTLINGEQTKVLSYGVSSFGYDIRISRDSFKYVENIPGEVINPKNFNKDSLKDAKLHTDEYGEYFVLPGNSYGLGLSVEKFDIPADIIAICIGKSTYCRVAIACNISPLEPGWRGKLVLEIQSCSNADCRIYANEGIAQLLFFSGLVPTTTYSDRKGKYQDQDRIVTAKV